SVARVRRATVSFPAPPPPPDDDEVAARVRGNRGSSLWTCRIGIHLELAAQRGSIAVIALAEDAQRVPILAVAKPHDDEVAARVRGDREVELVVRRVCVHLELAASGVPVPVETLAENAFAEAVVLAFRDDDKVAVCVRGDIPQAM